MAIKKNRNWVILSDQIVKGNVIPVIEPELGTTKDTPNLSTDFVKDMLQRLTL